MISIILNHFASMILKVKETKWRFCERERTTAKEIFFKSSLIGYFQALHTIDLACCKRNGNSKQFQDTQVEFGHCAESLFTHFFISRNLHFVFLGFQSI